MTKQEIEAKVEAMAASLIEHHGASIQNLKRDCRLFIMDAIRETEDEAKSIAYDAIARIGAKRKES